MKRVGKDVSAKIRWESIAQQYADNISGAYHRQRLSAIERLLPSLVGKLVVDFGCGDIERTEYMNFHPTPPLLSRDDPDDMHRERPNPRSVDPWKRMFQCSMFGVLAKATVNRQDFLTRGR